MLASEARKVDTLTNSALRIAWAAPFFVILIFASGAEGDIAAMGVGSMLGIFGAGLLRMTLGEIFYVASIETLGFTRAFTTSVALYNIFTFALAFIFLDEAITGRIVIGAVLVIAGVYLAALYGRARLPAGAPSGGAGRRPRLRRRPRQSVPPALSGTADPNPPAAGSAGAPSARPLSLRGTPTRSVGVGLLFAVVTAIAWAIGTVWLRDAGDDFDPGVVAGMRLWPAAILMFTAASLYPRTTLRQRTVDHRSLVILGIAGVIGIGLSGVLLVTALQKVGAAQTGVFASMSPLFALPLSAIFLRERITVWVGGGTALAVGGIALLAS